MTTDDLSLVRLREQQRNAVIFKRRLTEESGGMMSADEVEALLGLPSAAVRDAISARELFVVEDDGELCFPALQFDGATVRPGLIAVLTAAPHTSGWRLLQYLLHADDGLAGNKPVDLIRGSAEDIERAVRFARRLET